MPRVLFPPSSGGSSGPPSQVVGAFIAGETIAVGDLISLLADGSANSGRAVKTNATRDFSLVGVATTVATVGNAVSVARVGVLPISMAQAPLSSANGQELFADPSSPGRGTLTVPTSGCNLMSVGFLAGANGATTMPPVLLQPTFICSLA